MNEEGFTLVETLAALVVGAMLLGSISWVVSGLTGDLKAAERADSDREIVKAATLLDRVLSEARFVDQDGTVLARSIEALIFEMPAPKSLQRSGLIQAKISARPDSEGQSLVFEIIDTDIPATQLIGGQRLIEFEYAENNDQTYPGRFVDEIKLSIRSSDKPNPTILKFHPKINATGACIFDPISQRCRT